ncbi:hypothetical protein Cni_G19388 [Canna indica]|uniref:Uncharacterized protein n=1 Tax=Canna indica TaxID=4628 RepID=A0AAQ3KL31_9LILI|nr:hypothetical protein Cni_G19388 [Canna indica]
MFNKIIKRANRKPPKPEYAAEPTSFPAGAGSVSSVTVNHDASRTTLSSSGAAPQIECLPLFRDVPVPERQVLFLRKLQICAVVFDFSDTLKMIREKEVKRQTLSELVDFVQFGSGRLKEPVQEELVRTVGINIFRCLPPASHENTVSEAADPEEEDPFLDPAWPHLQLVYELLLRYVISSDTDTKVAKRPGYLTKCHPLVAMKSLNSFLGTWENVSSLVTYLFHRIKEDKGLYVEGVVGGDDDDDDGGGGGNMKKEKKECRDYGRAKGG